VTRRAGARYRFARASLAATLALVGVVSHWSGSPPPARAGSEAVPDLAMAELQDVRIQWVNGRRLLRFTAMMVNVGSGHFQLSGHRTSTSRPMVMRQVIFETSSHSSPVSRRIRTDAVAKYSGDGHNHWHVQEMMRYDLWGGDERLRGAKVGFCFLDSDPWNLSLPGATGAYYRGSWCKTDPNALSNRMGISIGWGDEYEWYLAWQWVDITGLPSGTYTLRAMVDPYGFFLEEREANQCSYAKLGISGSRVTLHSRARVCATDWSETAFATDIRWMFDAGITSGCLPGRLYCPNDLVSRAAMASFLVRTFDIPWTPRDFFTDDEGLIHEGAINRVAKAGIISGCQPTRFCPGIRVTRGQLASFLSRTLELPAPSDDYFNDDDGTAHEDAINRTFEAGISQGCTATRFCPDRRVTRGQLAAFLHRAARH
jgi:lysyl oxidase/S-layer family protein